MAEFERRQMRRDKKFLKWIVVLFVVVCVISIGRQVWRLFELQKETSATKNRIEKLELEQDRLRDEKDKLHTSEYVEKIAREEYNMIGKNEIPIFIVKDENEKEKTSGK